MPNNIKFLLADKAFPSMYGHIAFPVETNFYGSVSAILSATKNQQKENALTYWFRGLVRELGLKEAIEERDRTLQRGRNIDYTVEKMFADESAPEYNNIKTSNYRIDTRAFHYWKYSMLDMLAVELPVWSHTNKYKGRLDVLACTEDCLYLVDNKGSNTEKTMAMQEDYLFQVVAYRQALKEMVRNRRYCEYTDKLLGYLPSLISKVKNFKCRLVYFIDGQDTPTIVEIADDSSDYRLNGKYIFKAFKEKLRTFYSLPIVIKDETEGFHRARWYRVKEENIYTSTQFDTLIKERIAECKPAKINLNSFTKKYL